MQDYVKGARLIWPTQRHLPTQIWKHCQSGLQSVTPFEQEKFILRKPHLKEVLKCVIVLL
jgi:hypothetical protein